MLLREARRVRVEIWSDISCPWCYIGKARFDRALQVFPHHVDVIYRSFELDPKLRHTVSTTSYAHARKYGMSPAMARDAEERLAALARAEGLTYIVETRDHGNTFDLHRLLHLAERDGLRGNLTDAFFSANFADRRSIFDRAHQSEVAIRTGLDAKQVEALLDDPTAYATSVRSDEAAARELGITSVPSYVVDGSYVVSGAQASEVFLDLFRGASGDSARSSLSQRHGNDPSPIGDGARG